MASHKILELIELVRGQNLQIREATVYTEDGEEIARKHHRETLELSCEDVSDELRACAAHMQELTASCLAALRLKRAQSQVDALKKAIADNPELQADLDKANAELAKLQAV